MARTLGEPAPEPQELADGPSHPAPGSNLPAALSSFVGRAGDLADIRAALQAYRMVTLTGAGGVGKSRLALEFARQRCGDFADGCWLVELASVADPDLIDSVIASVLGVPEHPERPIIESVAARLDSAAALILLDNCEHLIGTVAATASVLLSRCDGLHIIATSRERIGVPGELVQIVQGLSAPIPENDPASVGCTESVQLFIERARALRPKITITSVNARSIARICARLDGLPLAIELAASRAGSMTVDDIAARMDDRFALLTRGSRVALPHHHALLAAVDWSFALLGPAERRLFDSLSVFSGNFGVDDVHAVCGPHVEADTDSLLAGLVDKSLVVFDAGAGSAAYHLLETLRSYGQAHVRDCGLLDRLERTHAAHYCAFAETAARFFRGPHEAPWLLRLEDSHANLRAALTSSVARGDTETAYRIAGALPHFWDLHGHFREGRQGLSTVLAMPGDVGPELTARVLFGAGVLAMLQSDVVPARAAFDRGAEICRQRGRDVDLARMLQYRGLTDIFADELDAAEASIRESLALARSAHAAGSPHSDLALGWALVLLAGVELGREDHAAAARDAEAAEEFMRALGDREGIGFTSVIRAATAWRTDRLPEATVFARNLLVAYQDLGGLNGLSLGLLVAGLIASSGSQLARMAELLGAAEELFSAMGTNVVPFGQRWVTESVGKATVALGVGAFETYRRSGAERARSDLGGLVTEVLDDLDRAASTATGVTPILTRRERQVAALVTLGRTNRQIARALGIAEKTAEVHVHHIAKKLGAASRAEVAAWFATDRAVSELKSK